MPPPRILLFCGQMDHVYQATRFIPGTYSVSVFPVGQQLTEEDLQPLPAVILIFPEDAPEVAIDRLKEMEQRLAGTPVLFIGEEPAGTLAIQAFREGLRDYLLLPLEPDVFLEKLEKYARLRSSSKPGKWSQKLRWLLGGLGQKSDLYPLFSKSSSSIQPLKYLLLEPEGGSENHDLVVRFFGRLTITWRGETLPLLPGEKTNALLAYLLYQHPKPVHRETLLLKFWGYSNPVSARNSLKVAMYNLRRHLQEFFPGTELVIYDNDYYSVNPSLDIITDTFEFLEQWKKGRSVELTHNLDQALVVYQQAITFYRGDFLEGIHHEEWCDAERDNLKEIFLFMLDRVGAYFCRQEAFTAAVNVFQKMLDKDNCLEDVHRKLMVCYYQLGLRDKAVRQYYKCAEALKRELGIEPSQATRDLFCKVSSEKNVPLLF